MLNFSVLKDRVKFVRLHCNGGTQAEFAKTIKVSEARVKSLETGRVKDLHPIEANEVVKNFNVSMDWLLSGDGDIYNYRDMPISRLMELVECDGDGNAENILGGLYLSGYVDRLPAEYLSKTIDDLKEAALKRDREALKLMVAIDPLWDIINFGDEYHDEVSDIFDEQHKEELLSEQLDSLSDNQIQDLRKKGTPPIKDFIQVPVYDIQASAGPGTLVESEEQKAVINFSPYYLSSLGVPSSKAAIIYVKGDSMRPTLNPEVPVLIDLSIQSMQQDGIYVIRIGNTLHVKRIQRQLDGSLKIISDNQVYEPYVISGADLEQVQIVGRVVLSVTLF